MTSGSGPASTGDQLEQSDVDLLILGAGPAGTSAAIRARQRGLSVLIADKAAFPRDKICGDGLTTNALRYLRLLGVDVTSLSSSAAVGSVLLRSPSGREVSLELPSSDGSYAVVTMRRELDNALFQHAVAAGAASLERASIVATVLMPMYYRLNLTSIYGFNKHLQLQYRGRLDSSGRAPAAPDVRRELVDAMRLIAATGNGPAEQVASMGCSIKWRS